MHVVIPFALSDDPACRQAAQALKLPVLQQLLQVLSPVSHTDSPPSGGALAHEHLKANAWGLPLSAGYAWAALEAAQQGLDTTQAWAYVTPCHWQVGQASVIMGHPGDLQLQAQELDALRSVMQDFFAEDGITLHAAPGQSHWLASGEVFRHLQTAPMARAIGRDVSPWLPPSDLLRRLQNEMQMLFYTHPVNDARSQARAWPVNSVWFSDSGALPRDMPMPVNLRAQAADWRQADDLQDAALHNNWPAWQQCWESLDATLLPTLLQESTTGPVRLSLCSEDRVLTLSNEPRPWWHRVRQRMSPPGLKTIWNAL